MAAAAAVLETLRPVPSSPPRRSPTTASACCSKSARAAVACGSRLVDALDAGGVDAACEGAELLWLETPTNPLLDVADIAALSAGARARGAA